MRSSSNEILWADRKRYCGLPLSFESYQMSGDRLFLTTGLWIQRESQIELYKVQDLRMTRTFSQRLYGVGTVIVTTMHNKVVTLHNIRNPADVKELLYECIEEEKARKWYRHFGSMPLGYS